VISGGNHSQFGFYGTYPFDGTPTISHASQIAQTIKILLAALSETDSARDGTPTGEHAAGISSP
jgi:hypothetical protein